MSNAILDNDESLLGMALALKPYGTHPATGARWCSTGSRAKDGRRVILEHVRVGAKLFTSAMALKRFFTALTGDPATPAAPKPSQAERRKSAEAAMNELIAAGA